MGLNIHCKHLSYDGHVPDHSLWTPQVRGRAVGCKWLDWIGLNLFNDDTCPTGHTLAVLHKLVPVQVGVSQSCPHMGLNKRDCSRYAHHVGWGLKTQIPLASPLGSELVGVIGLTPCSTYVINGKSLSTRMARSRRFLGQDMWLCGLAMTNSKPGDNNLLNPG